MPEQHKEELEEMGFLDHLEELRSTLISCIIAWVGVSIVLWFFSGRALDFLLDGLPVESVYFNAPTEAFMIRLKLSFILGFLAAFPYILFKVWSFVSPGLFSREKHVVFPLVFSATALFYLGVVFAYWVLVPIVLEFLVKFGTEMLQPLLSIGKYFAFVARLCFAFGVVFQLPLVIIFLTSIGAISARALLRQWRWAILVIFIVAAVLTPPDPASQLLMALPLVLLFLVSVLLSIIIEKRRDSREARGDDG
ncbi:MAG TPA: twin-arginine translocase subunit TatC [Candidatus Eisenbacteria bacterium]|uniref:Sec-independent protein translocase protein TatC n=1 Tax=Eiseniibacteriota bacterium TaxID=2212470 RepID=A0A7V2AWA0_UNCEI|nr:twin-arginine translocase subunit TatC [Candidatus Eisenbacteria bacterium]